jgi:hypothetical protein
MDRFTPAVPLKRGDKRQLAQPMCTWCETLQRAHHYFSICSVVLFRGRSRSVFAFLIAAGAMLVAMAVSAAFSLTGAERGNERFTLRSN